MIKAALVGMIVQAFLSATLGAIKAIDLTPAQQFCAAGFYLLIFIIICILYPNAP